MNVFQQDYMSENGYRNGLANYVLKPFSSVNLIVGHNTAWKIKKLDDLL